MRKTKEVLRLVNSPVTAKVPGPTTRSPGSTNHLAARCLKLQLRLEPKMLKKWRHKRL